MSVIVFNPQVKTIKWMIKMINENPGKLFDGSSDIYNEFWQSYADLEGINLPYELDLPYVQEYFLTENNNKEDYSDWYKRKYKEFCTRIKEVKDILINYIEGR